MEIAASNSRPIGYDRMIVQTCILYKLKASSGYTVSFLLSLIRSLVTNGVTQAVQVQKTRSPTWLLLGFL